MITNLYTEPAVFMKYLSLFQNYFVKQLHNDPLRLLLFILHMWELRIRDVYPAASKRSGGQIQIWLWRALN